MDLLHLVRLRLRFTRETRLHFFHHPAVYAALMDRLGTPHRLPPGVALYAPERGRVRFGAGEPCHLGFALRPGGPLTPARVAELFTRPPAGDYGRSEGAPFGDNFTVEEAQDLVAGAPLGPSPPAALTLERLREAAELLAAEREVKVRFLSPLLILRTPVASKEYIMDGEVFLPDVFLERVRESAADWWPDAQFIPAPLPPGCSGGAAVTLAQNRLAHTDVAYPKKRLLGAAGSVVLRFPEGVGPWALPLLLGGVVGVGKARNMGQGRFAVDGHPLPVPWPPLPARTILERSAAPDNLAVARAGLAEAGPAAGVDGLGRDEFLDSLTLEMPRYAAELRGGDVRPAPLKGFVLREAGSDGGEKLRPLAVPAMRDRFLQRAVLQELEAAVDQLLEDSSFAYRKGLSVRMARHSVDEARREGFTHVLDADIRSFFDEVDWDKLRLRLEAYFGDDPVVGALMQWVQAPVEFEGRLVRRTRGLPQGLVVSPMLANVYLDAFDEAIAGRGFRLVRYADDFLVLCRSREEANRARAAAGEELRRLGLALNPETRAASFDDGFHFLGALFCRSVVMEQPSVHHRAAGALTSLPDALRRDPFRARLSGWLADWAAGLPPEDEPTAGQSASPAGAPEKPRRRPPVPMADPERRPVYVVGRCKCVRARGRGLLIEPEQGAPVAVAWDEISELVLLGRRPVSAAVLERAMLARVPVAFHRWDGAPVGLVLPEGVRSPSPAALRQWEWQRDPAIRLAAARALVEAKIRNTRLTARRRPGVEALLDALADHLRHAGLAESLETLRGVEGQAAQAYFAQWDRWLMDGPLRFPGRVSPHAADPVNAMLNLLYTQLYRKAHLSALSAGLDPYLGVLHEGDGRYAALAADLMEPFRFLVDRVVLAAVNHRRVAAEDFTFCEKGPLPVRLGSEAVKRLIAALEDLLAARVADADGAGATFAVHLHRQTLALRRHIEGEEPSFKPFQMKW